jgi:hypothetical protein
MQCWQWAKSVGMTPRKVTFTGDLFTGLVLDHYGLVDLENIAMLVDHHGFGLGIPKDPAQR